MSTSADPTIRLMTPADVPAAMELSSHTGWNQTPEDWQMLIELAPQGCFAVDVDGRLAATTTLVCYGRSLAWLGMVLTRVDCRGRGFARALLSKALTRADEMGIPAVKLDATEQGQPLYEKLGFCPEQHVQRWFLAGSNKPGAGSRQRTLDPAFLELDRNAFAIERSHLLQKLAKRSTVRCKAGGFLFSRPGSRARYLGPCVAKDRETARELSDLEIRSSSVNGWFWDILERNREAVSLAQQLGFEPQRHLLRMARGKDVAGHDELVYAIAGFELG